MNESSFGGNLVVLIYICALQFLHKHAAYVLWFFFVVGQETVWLMWSIQLSQNKVNEIFF